MKKLTKSILLMAISAIAFLSCEKQNMIENVVTPQDDEIVLLTINSSAPEDDVTKTAISGTTPIWTAGDKVSVIYTNTSNEVVTVESSALASDAAEATFSASLTSPKTDVEGYAFYPANDKVATSTTATLVINSDQTPLGSTFDGSSDILISKSFTPSGSVDTQFKRLGAVLKIKLNNASLASEKLLCISVQGDNPLAGDVAVSLIDGVVTGIANGSNTVTATYESANQFTLNADGKFVYLIVYPQTLASGSHLVINGETENATFSKDITLSQDIDLKSGHIQPLNVAISSVTLKDKVFLESRFDGNVGTGGNDDKWSGSIASSTTTDVEGWTLSNDKGAYQCIKLSSGSGGGSAKTPSLTIPSVYSSVKLSFKAGAWSGDNTTMSISASNATIKNDSNQAVTSVSLSDASWTSYVYNITSITGNIDITFSSAKSKRFFLDDVIIYYGTAPKKNAGLAYATSSVIKAVDDPSFTNPLTNPYNLTISYESSDPSVASVNASTGLVSIQKAGSTRITASFAGNSEYNAGSTYYDLTITAAPITAFSWSRSGMTNTVTSGYTLSATASGKSGYYQDASSGTGYITVYNENTPMFSSTPSAIILEASIGGGTGNTELSNNVYACLVDSSGNDIAGTEIVITKHITTASGDSYEKSFAPIASAYGVKVYHEKESGYNVRYFSFSLKYVE